MSEHERVLVCCPVCGWESSPHDVAQDQPNGRWLAFSYGAAEYREHFAREHRPPPQVVVYSEAALVNPGAPDE